MLKRPSLGFTLIEIAIVLLILGLLIMAVMQGEELIQSARVKSLISQQDAVQTAILGFQDRYRALPGDYREASTAIPCTPQCPNGDGNGRILSGGPPNESIMVWTHLAGAGFLSSEFSATSSTSLPEPENTPTNVFGSYMQVAFDDDWGFSSNTTSRHTIKTGNHIPVAIMGEVDRKADDGLPTAGRIQFSPYAADGSNPAWGGAGDACVSIDAPDPNATWQEGNGQSNCGGATLL